MNTLNDIRHQILQAAESLLKQQGSLSPLEVLVKVHLLHPVHLEEWKSGKIPYLEFILEKDLHKIRYLTKWLHTWALQKGLRPQEMTYLSKGNNLSQKQLEFTRNGRPQTELLYRTHFRTPESSKQKKPTSPLPAASEKPAILVFAGHGQCTQCGKSLIRGSLYCRRGTRSYCISCGDSMISSFSKFEKSYG